jgi:hypothetical protein
MLTDMSGITPSKKMHLVIVFGASKTSWTSRRLFYPVFTSSSRDASLRMDFLINTKNTVAQTELKTILGLEALRDIRDVALTIAVSPPSFSAIIMTERPYAQFPIGVRFSHPYLPPDSNESSALRRTPSFTQRPHGKS